MPGARMLKMVVMKLAAPRIEEAPAKCRPNRAMSSPGPPWYWLSDSGGYSVQPVPVPPTKRLATVSMKAGTSSQKEMLFRRGKAMSGAPIMIGTNQLPKPPISAGMTT
jgi:hypothetical protein